MMLATLSLSISLPWQSFKIISCNTEKIEPGKCKYSPFKYIYWELISIKSLALNKEEKLPEFEHPLTLYFSSDSTFNYRKEVNSCFGVYRLVKANCFHVLSAGTCSEACCDGEWGKRYLQALLQTDKLCRKGDTLILYGQIENLKFSRQASGMR